MRVASAINRQIASTSISRDWIFYMKGNTNQPLRVSGKLYEFNRSIPMRSTTSAKRPKLLLPHHVVVWPDARNGRPNGWEPAFAVGIGDRLLRCPIARKKRGFATCSIEEIYRAEHSAEDSAEVLAAASPTLSV